MKINKMFNEIISQRGIKQAYICDKTGWSADKVSKILRSERKMTAEDFLILCNVLDISPAAFTDCYTAVA